MASKRRKSKKRSRTPALPDLVFFADRNLDTPTFKEPLEAAGWHIEGHNSHFPDPRTTDVEWLRFVAKRGWAVLTADKGIRYDSVETREVMEQGVALFILTSRRIHHELFARNLVRTQHKILRFAKHHNPPFIAKITRPNQKDEALGRPGHVKMYCSYEQWLEHQKKR